MKEKGDNQYRAEQMRTKKILMRDFGDCVHTEYLVKNLSVDGRIEPNALLDIAIVFPPTSWQRKNIAIRLMGPIHDTSKKQKEKDGWQKIALEQAGWIVIDLYHSKLPILFKKNIIDEAMILELNNCLKIETLRK